MAVRSLRPRPWFLILTIASALLFGAGLAFTYAQSGWSWLSLGFAGLFVFGCAAVLEVVTTRVVLHDDALECGAIWSRRRYPVVDIASVTWERGSGVALKLTDGRWAKLPELGYNSQGLTNTVRAWLKRSRSPAASAP